VHSTKRLLGISLGIALSIAAVVQPARAENTIYTYTGQDFTTNNVDSLTHFISATVILNTALTANLNQFTTAETSEVVSYTVTDGITTWSGPDQTLYISFTTDASANITNWGFGILPTPPIDVHAYPYLTVQNRPDLTPTDAVYTGLGGATEFSNLNSPGSWTVGAPEPATNLLLGSGLVLLAAGYQRRRARASR
jgi:hypothetical protein